MDNMLNLFDNTIIRQQLHRHTNEELANIIGKPIELIIDAINLFTKNGSIRLSKSQKINLKKKKSKDKIIKPIAATFPIKRVEKVFKTKQVDYSNKILVRIDAKTCIYIDKGADIEAEKKKYFKIHKKD